MNGAWERWWFDARPLERVALFRFFVLAATLWAVELHAGAILAAADAAELPHVRQTWRPIWLFQALGIPPPSGAFARVELVVLQVAIASAWIGFRTRASCAVAAVLALHWMGLGYSWGKPHHDFVATAFALAALPVAPIGARWSVDAWLASRRPHDAWLASRRPHDARLASRRGIAPPEIGPYAAFPLRVAQASLAIGYFFAGASKLAIGGLDWLNGYSLQAVLLSTSADWSEEAARSVALCSAMSVTTVGVQLLFPIALFWAPSRWFFVPAAIAFHLMSGKTMGTGWFFTLWFTLAAFVPLELAVRRETWTASPLRVAAAAALLSFAAVVVTAYFGLVSTAWLALAPVPWIAERAAARRRSAATALAA